MENSGISWTDHTFNPWMGCTKVSAGCANCYAERDMDHRYGRVQWGPGGTRVVTGEANWSKPIKWNRDAAQGLMLNHKGDALLKPFLDSESPSNWITEPLNVDGKLTSDLQGWRPVLRQSN